MKTVAQETFDETCTRVMATGITEDDIKFLKENSVWNNLKHSVWDQLKHELSLNETHF